MSRARNKKIIESTQTVLPSEASAKGHRGQIDRALAGGEATHRSKRCVAGPHPRGAINLAPTGPALRSAWLHSHDKIRQSGSHRYPRYILAIFCLLLLLALALTACNDQSQKPDPRLKYFTILDSRVLIADNQAEVFGDVENTSQMKFPFDVTMQANLMDNNGQSVGNAVGTAEDVGPGQVRQFVLVGTVDGTRYAKLKVTAVSLQEKRQELGMPTPTPINP